MAENEESIVVDEKLVESEDLSQVENPDAALQKTLDETANIGGGIGVEGEIVFSRVDSKTVWPVKPGTGLKNTLYISEKFGARRNGGRTHNGVDFGTNSTPGHIAKAYKSGTVIKVFVNDAPRNSGFHGYGKVVVMKHLDGTISIYAHLASVASKIVAAKNKNGEVPNVFIKQNEAVGIIGKSGSCYGGKGPYGGTHLHFEVRRNNKPIRPDLPTGGKYKCANGKDTKWYV